MNHVVEHGDNIKNLWLRHPHTRPVSPDALLVGNTSPPQLHPVVFDEITVSNLNTPIFLGNSRGPKNTKKSVHMQRQRELAAAPSIKCCVSVLLKYAVHLDNFPTFGGV